jgi:predicted transcriptional regulator
MKGKPNQKKVEIMDRAALKAIASQLKDAGSSIKVFKTDTDDALQLKVNESIQQIPSAVVSAQLNDISPVKLVTIKRDCFGVFIDFSDVSCVRCTHAQTCVREYLNNISDAKGGNLVSLKLAMSTVDEQKQETPAAAAPKKQKKVTYEPDRYVFVKNMKNPNKKGTDEHAVLQAILDEVPGTMSELREIIARDFDQTDKEFLTFLTALRDVGTVKLDVDLTDENKAELRAAGFEI